MECSKNIVYKRVILLFLSLFTLNACEPTPQNGIDVDSSPTMQAQLELSDTQIEEIIEHSWQYVAMYNVNNKFAMDPTNPLSTEGWNRIKANTTLTDHTLQAIPRPNNDTLYIIAMLDLTREPIIIDSPAFDSSYVSMMATGYDHFVNIPMSTAYGDFSNPSRILFYSENSSGYTGEAIEGIDKVEKMTGDYVSVLFRVMPHQAEPARMQRNIESMQQVKLLTLAEYRSETPLPLNEIEFPDFGANDIDIFGNNLLEVMQFVFNHTSFDPGNELDQKLLALYEPLGVVPGQEFKASNVATIDKVKFRQIAESVAQNGLSMMTDSDFIAENILNLFKPKGQMPLNLLLIQSITGPIGQPATEALYPPVMTTDASPMNALNDYVLHMSKEGLPPALAFWSVTLYDTENGFFIPNDQKKYSIGENGGMKLDDDGGISIYITAEYPEGTPEENWLPLVRGDYGIDLNMRLYTPDIEAFKNWTAPRVEIIQ